VVSQHPQPAPVHTEPVGVPVTMNERPE
jgi:hypothetical protein